MSQDLTVLSIGGCGGMGVTGLVYEVVRQGGREHEFFFKLNIGAI